MTEISKVEVVARAKEIVRREAEAVRALAAQFDDSLMDVVSLLLECRGHVLVTGAGTSRAIAQGRAKPETQARLKARIALGRLGVPEDCAKVLEFLVTDLSDYVTGQCIAVCGGCVLF